VTSLHIKAGRRAMSEDPSVDGRRTAGRFVAAVLASLVGVLGAASPRMVAAQQSVPVPDFTIDSKSAWLMVGDDFLPPPGGRPGPITFDKRYPYVDNAAARRTGTQPTYRVADLSNPILKPWVVEEMRKANDWVLAGKIPFRARERCYPAGVPGWVIYTLAEPISILQTDKQVTMINHGGPEVRRIYLDVPHSANPKPSWYGESVGHYEGGDTLVVDTIAISTKTFIDNYRTPHTDQLHVIERYKLIDSGKMMEVMISVDDPGAFTTPWLAMQRFRRVQREWTEDICAENNFDFLQYEVAPLPQAAKPDF
jgi:hypothetical protein